MDCQGAGHHSGNRGEALANEKSQQGRACDQFFEMPGRLPWGRGRGICSWVEHQYLINFKICQCSRKVQKTVGRLICIILHNNIRDTLLEK